jgi:hypothetical protein
MATYNFRNVDNGLSYFVRGPASLTKEQAERIYNQQQSAGALIAIQPGQAITAEFQLSNGLTTAQSAVTKDIAQFSSVIADKLGELPKIGVTDGITIANYAKQAPVVEGIKNISSVEVTGVLAQCQNLTQQKATEATNLGAGKYAFTVSQLERAGYVKPGTTTTYMTSGTRSTLTVLNMTEIWSGKDGISNLTQLLSNSSLQDTIQQFLMSSGLDQLAEVGIDVDQLPSKTQAGLACLSAIDPALAVNWVKNTSATASIAVLGRIGPATSAAITAGGFKNWQTPDRIVRDAAFACEFSVTKTNNAMRNETAEVFVINPETIVEQQVINFACNQIVGNDKVAKIGYGGTLPPADLVQTLTELTQELTSISNQTTAALEQKITVFNASVRRTQLETYRKELVNLNANFSLLTDKALTATPVSAQFLANIEVQRLSIQNLVLRIDQVLQVIAQVLGQRTIRTLGDIVTGAGV